MSAAMDSWEKIEQEMEEVLERTKPGEPALQKVLELGVWIRRLRALRERDEKRWEIVREEEAFLRRVADEVIEGLDAEGLRFVADRLREAREGK